MKNLFLLLCIFIAEKSFSQTKMIAHKSHSGKLSTFSVFGSKDNFGEPPYSIDSIVKISETKLVEISNRFYMVRDTMLIKNHPYFKDQKTSIERIKKEHPYIIFVGFKTRNKEGKTKK